MHESNELTRLAAMLDQDGDEHGVGAQLRQLAQKSAAVYQQMTIHGEGGEFSASTLEAIAAAMIRMGVAVPEGKELQRAHAESMVIELCHAIVSRTADGVGTEAVPPFGPMLKTIALHCDLSECGSFDGRPMNDAVADAIAWCEPPQSQSSPANSAEAVAVVPPLIEFARWAISESSFSGYDLDGGSIQDKAHRLGLLKQVQVTEPCNEFHCACADAGADFPTICYRFSEMLAMSKTQEAASNG